MDTLDLLWAVRKAKDSRLRGIHRQALCALLMYRDKNAIIDASAQQLADGIGIGRSTMLRALAELEVFGVVTSKFRGWHRSSLYEIADDALTAMSTAAPEQTVDRDNGRIHRRPSRRPSTASHSETSPSETSPGETSRSEHYPCSQRALPVLPASTTRAPSETLLRISSEDLSEDLSADAPAFALAAPDAPKKGKRKGPNVRTYLTADWQPSREIVAGMRADGLDVGAILDEFKSHWIDKAKASADWNARLRQRVRQILRTDWLRTTFTAPLEEPAPAPKKIYDPPATPTPEQRAKLLAFIAPDPPPDHVFAGGPAPCTEVTE